MDGPAVWAEGQTYAIAMEMIAVDQFLFEQAASSPIKVLLH
jgi:hypothetical protein